MPDTVHPLHRLFESTVSDGLGLAEPPARGPLHGALGGRREVGVQSVDAVGALFAGHAVVYERPSLVAGGDTGIGGLAVE